MNIDERLEALTMNLELQARETEELRQRIEEMRLLIREDGVHIRALARIAEVQNRRLERLEGAR